MAEGLCARFPRAVHIPVDDVRDWVLSGRAIPIEEWTGETTLQFSLARRVAALAAVLYSDEGFAVVTDDVVREPDLIDYAPRLGGRPLRKVFLTPALDICLERNRVRTHKRFDTRTLEPVIRRLHVGLAAANTPGAGWLVIDSSGLTVEETVDRIVAFEA